MNQLCPVTYKFYIKNVPTDMQHYIAVQVVIYDTHQHIKTNKIPQIRGKAREDLAKKIMIKHGGSSYEARLADLADKGMFLNQITNTNFEILSFLKAKHQH
jgi:hypothetical protein